MEKPTLHRETILKRKPKTKNKRKTENTKINKNVFIILIWVVMFPEFSSNVYMKN